MIEAWAIKFITSPWGRYIILGLTVLAGLFTALRVRDRRTAKRAVNDIIQKEQRRGTEGKDAFHEKRRQNIGRDADALLDGLRSRSDDWGRVRDLR